jgi:hypothetical protein
MQIPFKGSEFEPPTTRAVQARQELPLDAEYELKALQRLLAIDSLHTPKLLASKQETQPRSFRHFDYKNRYPTQPID